MNKYLTTVNDNLKILDPIDLYENNCILKLVISNDCCVGCYYSIY